jgi:hypothetical protein
MNLHRLPPPWRVVETTAFYGRKEINHLRHKESGKLNCFSKNTLDIYWRRRWPGNSMENLPYGNGVLLLVPVDDQTQKYAVIKVLNAETKSRVRQIRLMTKYAGETFEHRVSFSSMFLFIAHRNEYKTPLELSIYDLHGTSWRSRRVPSTLVSLQEQLIPYLYPKLED